MKISVCITTLNEEKTIEELLDSLFFQTLKPNEIIIVDGGSTDKTVEVINKYRIKDKRFKLLVHKGASIAKGRNIAVKNSRYPIIAMTDAGTVLEKHWLERITSPFLDKETEVVAGFYKMIGSSNFQKALMPFLGVMPDKFDSKTYLPSTRSIAFRKSVWEKLSGFNEKLDRAGEDTDFNIKISRQFPLGIKRVKSAIVYWEVPDDFFSAMKKFYFYSKGDSKMKMVTSHNMHTLSIFVRYLICFMYIALALIYDTSFVPLVFIALIYFYWSFNKSYKYFKSWQVGLWGTIIQIGSDFSVMLGFVYGIL